MTIRLVTSRPPRLSATVGPNAGDRPHDVALIQALLGEVTEHGRPILRNHLSGRFDDATAEALAYFCLGVGDTSRQPRLATGHPTFQKLARAGSFAVVEGTAAPIEIQASSQTPAIAPRHGIRLTPDEYDKLRAIVRSLTAEFGITFSIVVGRAPNDADTVVANFRPIGCSVNNGNRWCRNLNINNDSHPFMEIMTVTHS